MRDTITRIIEEVHQRYAGTMDGALADDIPELTLADPTHFGIALVTADGSRDVDVPFTIQSVSKAFTYGMAPDRWGRPRSRNASGSSHRGRRATRSVWTQGRGGHATR